MDQDMDVLYSVDMDKLMNCAIHIHRGSWVSSNVPAAVG